MAATYGTPTTNYTLPKIDGSSDVSDVDQGIGDLADAVDTVIAGRGSGTLSARPATAPDGFMYRTTDTGQVFLSTGSTWIEIGVSPWQPGDLKCSWLTTAPSGWLLCDGSAVSRATYAPLFAAIGTSAGPGNGSTTFNVPDARARALLMPDGSAARMASNDARGQSGGSETVTLTAAQIPDVPVSGVSAGGTPPSDIGGGIGIRADEITGGGGSNYSMATTYAGSFSFSLFANGGGGSHPNLGPYLVVGGVFIKF